MKKDLENLDFKFWSWFPSGIKDPKRINYFLNQRSKLLDREIIKKFEDFNLQADFSLFAIGGYGNKEIFPSSDIDISILQINSKIKDYSNLEKFVASLWDFGLKVGHSVRTEQDIKKIVTSDIKEFTSYLSLRPLSANKKSLEIIHKIFEKKEKLFPNNKFFIKKKIEQENRYLSFDTQKPCAQDFSYKVSDNGHTIIITDTDENNGSVCLIFNVECNGNKYESADPQVKNEKEL